MAIRTYQNWPNNSPNPNFIAMTEVLDRAHAFVAMEIATDKRKVNKKQGASVNLRRWENPAVNDTPNAEGQTPVSRALTARDYTGTMQRYAEVFEVSRYDYDLNPYDAVKGSADVMVDLIASTQERIRYNAARIATQVGYNGPTITARNQVNGPITLGRLQVAIRAIREAKGDVFKGVEQGGLKQGTSPIEPAYFAFTNSALEPDLRALPGFKTVSEYPTGKGVSKYEFGSVQNMRFLTSPEFDPYYGAGAAVGATGMLSRDGVNVDVYPIIIVAKHALTSVPLAGNGKMGFGNLDIKVLDQPDKSDPTNERIYIPASWYDLCLITAEEWIYLLEVGATANPT